jgi:hypothetical protein
MHYITDIKSIGNYILELTFEDGCVKRVDIKKFLEDDQDLFFRIKAVFEEVYINEVRSVEWPIGIGISFCSDVMYTEGVDVKGANKHFKFG